jgi:pimeloyl-ACP methyl ester carboxylesterase
MQRTRKIIPAGESRIEVIAEGEGPLLVLLPSSSRDSEDFDEIASQFAASGLRVLRPQPRGMGASVGWMENLTLHDFAADVAAVIEAEGGDPVVVLGHAFGQWVARTLAQTSCAAWCWPPPRQRRRRPSCAITLRGAPTPICLMWCAWPRCVSPSSPRVMIRHPG